MPIGNTSIFSPGVDLIVMATSEFQVLSKLVLRAKHIELRCIEFVSKSKFYMP